MQLKKLAGAFLIMGISLGSFAQKFDFDSTEYENAIPEPAAITVSDYTDPVADIYTYWNTSQIHYRDTSFLNHLDSTLLVLVNDSSPYCHPFAGDITSKFGMRRYRWHYGTDVDLVTGDTVRAAFDGIVRIRKYNKGGYGNTILIRHYNGLETLYGHLSKSLVDTGDFVHAGDAIGLGGNTGRSSGSHLHFETRYRGIAIDPQKVIDFAAMELKTDSLIIDSTTFDYIPELRSLSSAKYYKIRSGDTLSQIARRYGTSVNTLCRLNGMKPTTVLRIGRSIRVR